MSNPTKNECSNNIVQLPMTDFRPRKVLYSQVKNNNQFRLFLQQNAQKLMEENLKNVEKEVKCCACEKQPSEIVPYKCVKKTNDKKKEDPLDIFFQRLY